MGGTAKQASRRTERAPILSQTKPYPRSGGKTQQGSPSVDAGEDGVVTNPLTRQARRANKVAIDLAKTGAQAKVALAVMESWMSATHAGDVVEFLQVSFFQTQLVEKVSISAREE